LWQEAFAKVGLEMDLLNHKKEYGDPLPWSFIETGIPPAFLWEEYQKGLKGEISPPCHGKECHRCGICNGKTIRLRDSYPNEIRPRERIKGEKIRKKGIKTKVRLRFRKVGEMRFLSHLELAHLFYRASKRAEIPLCFSEGFHPMPRIIFASALPVGMESVMEIVDIELEGRMTPGKVMERLNQVLPQGIEIIEADEVLLSSPSCSLLHHSVYWIPLDHLLSKEEAIARIKKELEKKEILIHQERKGKKRNVDILPLIEKMDVKEKEGSPWGVELILRRVEGRTAKPLEILRAILGMEGESFTRCEVVKLE
jgi:radical SAM-linked protein